MSVWMCTPAYDAYRGQKKGSQIPGTEVIGSHEFLVCVLGTRLKSSVTAMWALNHGAVSLPQSYTFVIAGFM